MNRQFNVKSDKNRYQFGLVLSGSGWYLQSLKEKLIVPNGGLTSIGHGSIHSWNCLASQKAEKRRYMMVIIGLKCASLLALENQWSFRDSTVYCKPTKNSLPSTQHYDETIILPSYRRKHRIKFRAVALFIFSNADPYIYKKFWLICIRSMVCPNPKGHMSCYLG